MEKYNIITFYSTHLALRFEKLLKDEGIEVKIIPVPRQISSSCGLSGRFSKEDFDKVASLCSSQNMEYDDVYKVENGKYIIIENPF